MKNKFRISASLIELWLQGRTNEVVESYFHIKKTQITPQMVAGRDIHQNIANHIIKHKALPEYLPKIELTNPTPEIKMIVPYNDLFEVSAIFDVLDKPNILEFKTGVTSVLEWANTFQLPIYFLVSEIAKIEIEKAYLIHYNQYSKKTEWAVVWNGEEVKRKARNILDTVGPEIHNFFVEQGLL